MDYSYPLLCACERHSHRMALISRQRWLTYGELERKIAGLTAGLRAAGLAGRPVASLLLNEPETVALYMALARLGAVSIPLNTRLTLEEKRYILQDAGATHLVVDDDLLPEAEALSRALPRIEKVLSVGGHDGAPGIAELAGFEPEEPAGAEAGDERAAATITYTSGTTGFPKGVVRSHRANAWNAVNSALGSPRDRDDVELFNLPIFGIGFVHFAIPALLGGATLVLDRTFDAGRVWELLEIHRATRTFLAPTMISAMLDVEDHAARNLEALQVIYTAYAFPERLRAAALERFGDRFVYMYGLTEAQLTCARLGEFARKPTSVGRTMGAMRVRVLAEDGTTARIEETGEIVLEGPSVMTGYHGLPEATREGLVDGWVHTGDLGRIDSDGDLHYVGRKKEMIKTGGFSVDPVEVENAILVLDAVREVAVIGVEDERWGEMVVAFITPAEGEHISAQHVIDACRERIAGYKTPKHILMVDELPKNPTGKVERGTLRRWYHDQAERPARAGRQQSPMEGPSE